jgi:glutathione S-transferase
MTHPASLFPADQRNRLLGHLLQLDAALDYLNAYLDSRDYLLDRFTVADGYLVTVLNWSRATPVDLAKWPAVAAYRKRLKERPSIARALSEELALYAAKQKRHKAA